MTPASSTQPWSTASRWSALRQRSRSNLQESAEDKGVNLVRPVAESAGVLAFGERRLQLAGINPTPADKICTDSKGREWPCGMLAKTNVRLFLRLRTVRCDLDER